MKKLQEKLDFLLDKYSVKTTAVLKSSKRAVIGGTDVPLLSHRLERRFTELKSIVQNGTLQGVSAMRVSRIAERGADPFEELYREFDLCQYILGRKLTAVTAMQNGSALNVIAAAEGGVVCTIELAAGLAKGELPKDKHEIISRRGSACDVVVDAQLRQASVYVFGAKNAQYTDVDFELYGLSAEEIAVVRSAFTIAQKHTADEMVSLDRDLNALVEKAKASAGTGERQVV